jgi:enamine deaminase RidA (YjgF/YER057c/UK114 family)
MKGFGARAALIAFGVLLVRSTPAGAGTAAIDVRRIDPDPRTGASKFVVVENENIALVHTAQILAYQQQTLVGKDHPEKQAAAVLENLDVALRMAKSDSGGIVKLNVYLKTDGIRQSIEHVLAGRFHTGNAPAVTYVTGDLSDEPFALVAMDAVALSGSNAKSVSRSAPGPAGMADCAVLPAGPRIYISGMADTNELIAATGKTLEKLIAAAAHLGVDRKDIVQLKVFLQPIHAAVSVRRVIAKFFDDKAPPLVFVEWISPPPNPPVEIELIAAARGEGPDQQETVSFLTPPGTTSTKVFSRVARVNSGKMIYFSGLSGSAGQNGTDQTREILQSLRSLLPGAGTDFEHLVKATYYVSDDEASNALNEIRLEFFNPLRPPAASKAKVRGAGLAGRKICVDMIGVTK